MSKQRQTSTRNQSSAEKKQGKVKKHGKVQETKLPVYIPLGVAYADLLKHRLWEVFKRSKKSC